jgi:hypothetical protein
MLYHEKHMRTSLFIFLAMCVFAFVYAVAYSNSATNMLLEPYTNYSLGTTYGDYPKSETNLLVEDSFPITGNNGVSKEGADDIWWRYPIFEVGSFTQITNNLRFPSNPDTGKCMPANFCGALYKDAKHVSNVAKILKPVDVNSPGARVNFYTTKDNLLTFRTNEANVLY